MSEEECVDYIAKQKVEIPSDFQTDLNLGTFVKNVILEFEKNPDYQCIANWDVLIDFVENIGKAVNCYYNVSETSVNQYSVLDENYVLQDNLVKDIHGNWVSSGGYWDYNAFMNYNCYAYAIGRDENPNEYTTGFQYQPGDFAQTGEFSPNMSIQYLAQIVQDDLQFLGYNVSISSTLPSIDETKETLIALRKSSYDYHFMRYFPDIDAWLHKPGITQVLKYLYQPAYKSWISEYSIYGSEYLSAGLYDSQVYYIVYGNDIFTTELNTTGLTITGFCQGIIPPTYLQIPGSIDDTLVTQIGNNAFISQTQLTQINIPPTVTTIGSNAFQNTNNAPIYLNERALAPNTFDINWNSSGNPVYLNGNQCAHLSTTLTSINYTQHGDFCDTCRTFVNKENHIHNVMYVPIGTAPSGRAMHLAYCACGHSVAVPCVGALHNPGDTVTCIYCGQEFSNPLFMMTLPNGESFASNAPFTYTVFKQLVEHLELSYTYDDFVVLSESNIINYQIELKTVAILPNQKETLYECIE